MAGRGGPCFRVERSPDGRCAVIVALVSMRMSHEVEHAILYAFLYALPDERPIARSAPRRGAQTASCGRTQGAASRIDLSRYPRDAPGVSVTIDIPRGRARIGAGVDMAVAELSAALKADCWRRIGQGQKGSSR